MPRKLNRILVVDGSEVARTIITRIFNEEMPDTKITTCGTVQEACAWLERSHFDLITTALMLPDKDGIELCRYVRASKFHHYTPTIVVSGDADTRLLREGFAAGVTDYFDKSLGYHAFASFIMEFTLRHSGLVGRILYVEDSQLTATVMLSLMERHGLQVTHTTHAEEAIQLLRDTSPGGVREDEYFDIVITDFYLQGRLTGGDLLHAIRTRFHYSQQEMPVLVLTGSESGEKQVEVFHAGANDFVSKPIVEEVLLARIRSLLTIRQQFAALKRQTDEMHKLAITDSLTRVYNRRYLLDHGEHFVTNRHNHPVAAVLLDIDHFKKINDKFGHITGDRVLEALGKLLLDLLPDNALPVRFGGEEFALLVPRCAARDAHTCAEQLRISIEALRPANVPITVSIGLDTNQANPGMTLTQLIGNADRALYAAKAQGRNQVCA
ncbi:two-component system cell cycle response regulator [Thiogranum longum]|uniref:diguanylate cyclase n=1 Tax=Thiogranum longum TaxID=1537524 RepID=A0A4R1H5U6_9GAMM|nr:diguanylate cyclase [Thiogranum longum]TCK17094.1 two-component system cell cycle response regulator [Thiogranum longum]